MKIEELENDGVVTMASNFLEIRINFHQHETFVKAINDKLQEGWEIETVSGNGRFSVAYMSREGKFEEDD